jgi:hypothetical protein
MRMRTAQIKGRKHSVYVNNNAKKHQPTKINFSTDELYELSQVTREEAKRYEGKKES